MLANQREIAKTLLTQNEKEIYFNNITMSEVRDVIELHDNLVISKSALGFMINYTYDQLVAISSGNVAEFVNTVYEEISEPYRKFMFSLLERKSIEDMLNEYILDNLEEVSKAW